MSALHPRVFVCAPAALLAAIVETLPPSRLDIVASADPRSVKAAVAQAPLDAVVIHGSFGPPSPTDLARALKNALPPSTSFILLTDALVDAAPPPFHAAIRFPSGPGVVADRVARAVREAASAGPSDRRELAADIEVRALRLGEQTHFEVLGLTVGAPHDAIVAAYDALSLRFHPDRLRALTDPALKELGTQLYLRIGEAYRVLRGRTSREQYVESLRGGTGVRLEPQVVASTFDTARSLDELSANPRAKRHLRLAQQALAIKDNAMALVQMRFAVSQDPDNGLISKRLEDLESRLGGPAT